MLIDLLFNIMRKYNTEYESKSAIYKSATSVMRATTGMWKLLGCKNSRSDKLSFQLKDSSSNTLTKTKFL